MPSPQILEKHSNPRQIYFRDFDNGKLIEGCRQLGRRRIEHKKMIFDAFFKRTIQEILQISVQKNNVLFLKDRELPFFESKWKEWHICSKKIENICKKGILNTFIQRFEFGAVQKRANL